MSVELLLFALVVAAWLAQGVAMIRSGEWRPAWMLPVYRANRRLGAWRMTWWR